METALPWIMTPSISTHNQLVSELLVKTIARRGYVLAVGKETIRMI